MNVFQTNQIEATMNNQSNYTLCRHISLLFGICYVIGLENIRIHRPHVIEFVADLFFFRSGKRIKKKIRIRCRIRRMHVDGSSNRKDKVADLGAVHTYPDTSESVDFSFRI